MPTQDSSPSAPWSDYTCAIKTDKTVACWGDSRVNQTDPTSSEQDVDADTKFLAVSAGNSHNCGIKADGAVACWGADFFGETVPPSDIFSRTPDVFRLAERTPTTVLTTEDGGESARLNAVHTIGFAEKAISIGEGMSATVRLSISPTPADMVTVTLSSSNEERLAVAPSAAFAPGADSATAALSATDNPDKERGMEYAIFLSVPDRVPAYLRADTLRVTVSPR